MRIYDEDSDRTIKRVTLFLERDEASELRDSLEVLLGRDRNKEGHEHVSSKDYQKEIIVCIYDKDSFEGLHEHSKQIILEDK